MKVLHHDNHLLVVAKDAGTPCVPDDSGDESLLERAKAWVKHEYQKPGAVFLGVVHRLDRPVSGLVVFARTSKAADRLTRAFRDRRVEKRYVAIGIRPPRTPGGELEQWLEKDRAANRVHVRHPDHPGAKRALTRFRSDVFPSALGGGERARFELEPHTGRSHQLRVACASLGSPLLGDLRYGAPEPLPDRSVALHAVGLVLEHPTTRERKVFHCAPPERAWWAEAAGP